MIRAGTILIALLSAALLQELSPAIASRTVESTSQTTVLGRASRSSAPTCVELTARAMSLATSDEQPSTPAQQQEAMRLVRELEHEGSDCVEDLIDALVGGRACSGNAAFAMSTIALDDALSPETAEKALEANGPCVTALVTAAAQVPNPKPELVDAIERWELAQRDPIKRSGGLVVLGSLAHHAREGGDTLIGGRIDALLVRELGRPVASRMERIQRLEAAGNAGCLACRPIIGTALRDPSSEVRRAAAGALRFVSGELAPRAMCEALDGDDSTDVRDQAAWALAWGRGPAKLRVDCLVRAAARDLSVRVRMSAVRSLAGLATDVPRAREALLQLTDPDYGDPRVREFALSVVTALPPEATRSDVVAVR
jgi:hypothetical protein